ncbi:MAG TPA: DNA polymerase III subunit delta [Solirubrobacteraceae bacterium]|nr:DNA polymerase III subunit delta [Solirubrobacteraceae bacterium]
MAELKPAYLIHGDDHGAVAERRAGLRALAEAPGAETAVELLEGDQASPAGVAAALSAMTLAVGRRVIVAEGAERWRQADVEQQLAPLLAQMPPETTLALFAREEARAKAPAALHEAVKRAGGQVVAQMTVKPWELPKWVREQAPRLGVSLDAAAAKALVAQVGERQQRLLRELEKLALEGEAAGGGEADESAVTRSVTAEEIEQRAAHSAEHRAFALADALVGADEPEALLSYVRLRQQGERLSGLIYLMASRLREAVAVAARLQAGESEANVKRGLRMPARAASRFVADVSRSDPARLRAALGVLADLELDSRGGALVASERDPFAALDEDTVALRAIGRIAA